jgi:HEAT repeat protein
MKINMQEFKVHLDGLTEEDAGIRQRAVSGLAKYSDAEWESSPDAVMPVIEALVRSDHRRAGRTFDGPFRAEAAKALGNIGTRSKAVVPELLHLLQNDPDGAVRVEAARALGKIGAGAQPACQALAAVLTAQGGGDTLRGEVAWALVRVAPDAPDTAAALHAAAADRSGHVGVCAAAALGRIGDVSKAVPALAARLSDRRVRDAAVQALYRIGPKARQALPALLAAAKDKDRLFRESVVMALKKIDPDAAARAGIK